MLQKIRNWAREKLWYVQARELFREGLTNAFYRHRVQRKILRTIPIRTNTEGPVEVRVLTWRRDWINCLWALKSFYSLSRCDFPLYIHDGGLIGDQHRRIKQHFPDAVFVSGSDAESQTTSTLLRLGLKRSVEYRKKNISTRKLFDFYVMSKAERVITIDSDIVFFRDPAELVTSLNGRRVNLYNRDCFDAYSIEPSEIKARFGLSVPPRVNSGLASVWRDSISFPSIDQWLVYQPLFDNSWVTEQTLHAMCSAVFGMEFLPPSYVVSVTQGLTEGVVCKHYPTDPRIWLYREGMPKALQVYRQKRFG